MSKTNFFKSCYRIESPRREELCGIMDGVNENPAYTTTDKPIKSKWNATIKNENKREFMFVPIDHNIRIYKTDSDDLESTCDGMILVEKTNMLVFVELKDVNTGGMAKAINQLKNTINIFEQNHKNDNKYNTLKKRYAYVANIAHPRFNYNMKDEMEYFRTKLHFILRTEVIISID